MINQFKQSELMDVVLSGIDSIHRKFTKEEAINIFNILQGATSLVFIEFLLNPGTFFTTPDLMRSLNMVEGTAYASTKKLRKAGLIRVVGKQRPKINEDKWGTFSRGGGPDAQVYVLCKELE